MDIEEALKIGFRIKEELQRLMQPSNTDYAVAVLAAEVRRLREQSQWQPIETAPIGELIELAGYYPECSMTDIEVIILVQPFTEEQKTRPWFWRKHIPLPSAPDAIRARGNDE